MAKNDRQKRSARKARQAERAEHEAAIIENAVAQGEDPEKVKAELAAEASAKKSDDSKDKKPGPIKRLGLWFRDVAIEMKRVVWPTPKELRNYTFAVIGLLIVFGVIVWLVDTGVVAGLVQYSKLRPGYQEPTNVQTLSSDDIANLTNSGNVTIDSKGVVTTTSAAGAVSATSTPSVEKKDDASAEQKNTEQSGEVKATSAAPEVKE